MFNNLMGNILNSIVPISRFNKGEANKIFEEVSQSGYKIVVKNNKPACVLVDPKRFEEMLSIVNNSRTYPENFDRELESETVTQEVAEDPEELFEEEFEYESNHELVVDFE